MTEQQIRNDSERTDGGTEPVHEGFHQDDPSRFAGEWFSWSNAMFAEFVLSVCGPEVQADWPFPDKKQSTAEHRVCSAFFVIGLPETPAVIDSEVRRKKEAYRFGSKPGLKA